MKCEWLVVWYGGFNHCSKVQTALWQQHTRYKPLPVTLPSAGPWWLSVYQIGLPTLSNKFHGRKDTKLAFRSRCVVDNLRNQIKFSFIYQSSDFIGRPFVLCDLFELSGSNTSGSDEPKECRVFLCPSVVLTESYPTRFTHQSLEVILVHIWWPLNRCFVLSCDLWEWGKQIFIFISYFILVYHIRNIR